MKKFYIFTLVILLSATFNSCTNSSNSGTGNQVMNEILKRNSIKCSYLLYPPYFMKDPKTGKLSGIFYEIMEKIGQNSNLKIEWVEEVGYENIFSGLDNKRYDVFAGGLWPNATRAKVGYFSIPVFYSVIKAWCRSNDNRFENNLDAINSPNIKIARIDGAMEDIIAKSDFPKAGKESLTQLSPFTQNLQNITSNKADVTFAEPGVIYEYLAKNPGTLKDAAPKKPLRIFGNCLVLAKGETDLQEFIDNSLRELLYCGDVDKILKKYETNKNSFPRVALPYIMENN